MVHLLNKFKILWQNVTQAYWLYGNLYLGLCAGTKASSVLSPWFCECPCLPHMFMNTVSSRPSDETDAVAFSSCFSQLLISPQTSKGHYKRRYNHWSTLIVVYSELEISGNRFQTKPTWTHFTPKLITVQSYNKNVCGCPNSLGTPSMNESWAYVSITMQGASWVLLKGIRLPIFNQLYTITMSVVVYAN